MKGVGVLAIFALCLVFANGRMRKDMKRIAGILGLDYETGRPIELPDDDNAMTAQFNIDGVMEERKVMKRMINIITQYTPINWVKSESIQLVYYYLDGSSPMKVTILYPNGTLGVQYLGSLMDKRCEILNCKYEFLQPVGCNLKIELMDVEGWFLWSFIMSPTTEGRSELTIVSDSDLTCSL